MTPTFSVAAGEFNKVLREIGAQSSRTFPEVVNGQGLALAVRALKFTKKTSAGKIAVDMGQASTRVMSKGKNSKRLKHGVREFSRERQTLAYRIVVKRMLDSGKSFTDEDVVNAVKKMTAARIRAAAFIASGWIYAIRTLSKTVGYANAKVARYGKADAARMKGMAKGYAKPATRVWSGVVECEIANTALLHDGGPSPKAIAEQGLALAFVDSIKDMRRHMQEKVGSIFAKFYGR